MYNLIQISQPSPLASSHIQCNYKQIQVYHQEKATRGARHGVSGAVGSRARAKSIARASNRRATVANGAAAASSPGEIGLTRDAATSE